MRRRSVVLLSLASLVAGCRSCSSSSSGIDSAPVVFDAAPPTDVDIKKWPSATGAGTDIGDALPTNDAVGDPKRRWALVCQGDNLAQSTWRFVLGAGKGYAIDGLLAFAPSGDFLVLAVDGRTVLVDVAKANAHTLTSERTVAAFSKDEKKLVYVDKQEIVRLDLASGESNRVPLPGGKPVLVDVDTTGSWTMVSMVRNDDTNWYGPPDALACAQPDPFVLNFVQHGFPVWVDLESGREIGDKQIVRVAGGHVYRVEKDVLTIDDIPAGPKDCTGDLVLVSDLVSEEGLLVLGVVESPPRALVLCRRKNGPKTVMMVGPDKVLGSTKASLMGGGVNNVAPMILPKDGRTCEHFNSIDPTCLDVTTGAKSKGPLTEPVHVPGAQAGTRRFAETDDGWTLASDDDGSIEHIGPLRWIAPAK